MRLNPKYYFDLIGKPYAPNGYGPDAYGCVGLLLQVMRRLGHDLPRYEENEAVLLAAIGFGGEWTRVSIPLPGDGVLMRSNDPPWHVGVAIDQRHMLHAHPHAGVVVERMDGPMYRRRIEAFYRCNR